MSSTDVGTQLQPHGGSSVLDEGLRQVILDSPGVLHGIDEMAEYLSDVVHAVRRAVDGCEEVGITVLLGERPYTAAYTTAQTLRVDAVQYALDEGPCLEAHDTLKEVRADLDEAGGRWPRFIAETQDEHLRALIALPLRSGDGSVGALNLYARDAVALQDIDVDDLELVATRVGDAIAAAHEVIEARTLAGQLEQAMASRAVIEQAKGILMARQRITEQDAFDVLRRESQRRNIKLRAIASAVVREAVGA